MKAGGYRHLLGSGNSTTYRCGKDLACPVGASPFGTPARWERMEGREQERWEEETPKPALAQVPPAHLDRRAFRRNPPACLQVALHRAFTWWALEGWWQIFALRLPESGGISHQVSDGICLLTPWTRALEKAEKERQGEGEKYGNHNWQKVLETGDGKSVTNCKFFMSTAQCNMLDEYQEDQNSSVSRKRICDNECEVSTKHQNTSLLPNNQRTRACFQSDRRSFAAGRPPTPSPSPSPSQSVVVLVNPQKSTPKIHDFRRWYVYHPCWLKKRAPCLRRD